MPSNVLLNRLWFSSQILIAWHSLLWEYSEGVVLNNTPTFYGGATLSSCAFMGQLSLEEVLTFPCLSSVQLLSHVQLFATPWTAARLASLSFTIYRNPLKLMYVESVMPSNHLILSPLLLLPSIFSSIRVFSNGLALHIRWPKYWSFSFSIILSNGYSD